MTLSGEDDDAGCLPNIEYSASSSVEGVVYSVTPGELDRVDHCMGFPQVRARMRIDTVV